MSEDVKYKLNEKMDKAEVISHQEVRPGVHQFLVKGNEEVLAATELAYLSGKDGEATPVKYHTEGRVLTRDFMRRSYLDLVYLEPDPATAKADRLYSKALTLYRSRGAYGTAIDTFTNFSAKGFKNDIDDPDIKLFYDTWNREIGFQEVVEKIFFDFFRVGLVRTFKLVGKFDPKLKPESFTKVVKKRARANVSETSEDLKTIIAYRELAAAKKIWSKSFIPLKYTILDPRLIDIQGPLLFDQTDTFLKPAAFGEIKALLANPAKQTPEQQAFIRSLPKELLDQLKSTKSIRLPPELVGKCDYRKQDYERFPLPRVVRSLDSMDYKDQLIKADLSTLDGIANYILKITIGNDDFPVTKQEELDTIARLFDTPSKGFDIVWNHTLKIEKITFPEISQILGQPKFLQVNDDLTTGWGITRALLDGQVTGSNSSSIEAALKSFTEEVNYARRCVKRWIDSEYEEVALAMGFDRYPQVRFDENALKDEIMLMSVIQGMIDRRIISYESGIEKLGLDFDNELANMMQEAPMVQAGLLGIIGSPYNSKALPATTPPATKDTTPNGEPVTVTQKDLQDFQKNVQQMLQEGLKKMQPAVQPTQRTPKGTPSEGRPRKGGATKPLSRQTTPNTKPSKPK